VEFEMERGVR
jgi:hypothetical protein